MRAVRRIAGCLLTWGLMGNTQAAKAEAVGWLAKHDDAARERTAEEMGDSGDRGEMRNEDGDEGMEAEWREDERDKDALEGAVEARDASTAP